MSERALLLDHIEHGRAHVLACVDGLDEPDLTRPVAPSGWSIARMLGHLTYDDEIFWGGAIVAGDEECIALVQDGWQVPGTSGVDAVERYRHWSARVAALLAGVDLDAAPRWWPAAEVFPFAPFEDARTCLMRLLVETTTHAGHLDLAREGVDGHQHLVVG